MSERSVKIYPTKGKELSKRPYSWWWIVTAGALLLFLGIGSLYVFQILARPLGLVIIAISIATAIDPIVTFMCKKMYRIQAIILVYLALLVIAIVIGWLILPTVFTQLQQFVANAPNYLDSARTWIDQNTYLDPTTVIDWLGGQVGTMGASIVTVPMTIVTFVAEFLFTIFISIYWLISMPRLRAFTLSLFPSGIRDRADGVVAGMGQAMGGYLRGSVIDGIILGILKFAGLFLIGVPYAAVLALLTAVLELLPTIGVLIAGALAVLVALTVSPTMALIVLLFEVVLQQLEGNILLPIIMKSQAEIPPLLGIFAVVAGAFIGGLLGAIVAIPLAAALMVFTQTVLAPAIRTAVGAPEVEDHEESSVKEAIRRAEEGEDENLEEEVRRKKAQGQEGDEAND